MKSFLKAGMHTVIVPVSDGLIQTWVALGNTERTNAEEEMISFGTWITKGNSWRSARTIVSTPG